MRNTGMRHQVWGLLAALLIMFGTAISAQAISLQEEIDLGTKLDAEMLKETPASTDMAAQKEIDRIGQTIVKNGGLSRPQIVYHFKVLKDNDMNAFSTCGGRIYFTEHLWNVLRTDERAGVLAHEIVHSDRRHSLDAMLKLQKRSTILGAILIITGANRTVGDLVSMANQLSALKYSRGDEKQADELGLQYLHNAKLNPAGLLLAMRKINRFETEAGSKPPTILSNHPATPDRLNYITEDLRKMGVPIPPENVGTKTSSDKIGSVVAKSADSVQFTSSKPLKPGDIVWLMGQGWDYYYENNSPVPIARVMVTKGDASPTGRFYAVDAVKAKDIAKGTEVYAPPVPPVAGGVAKIPPALSGSQAIRLEPVGGVNLAKFDRLVAENTVWDAKEGKLINAGAGYMVITDPSSATGYVTVSRPKYAYAPLTTGATLTKLKDPDAARWVGTVISIGRSGQQVEVLPSKPLDTSRTYEIAYPAWDKDVPYAQRVVGVLRYGKPDKKIVMSIMQYTDGWGIADIQNGFDIYEQAPEQK